MQVKDWLKQSVSQLSSSHIATARLDCLVLLEDVTGKDRAWLLANQNWLLSEAQIKKLKNLLKRRMAHEPLAYLRGVTEFYGRNFIVSQQVLVPRPESETMIDCLIEILKSDNHASKKLVKHVADVGCGCGALGITAKLEQPDLEVDLIDIDQKALKVAKSNVDKFTLNISVIESDLLNETMKDYQLLLCNLPYVADDFKINLAASHEPKLAIYGGPDGLDVYRKLFDQLSKVYLKPLYILTEALPPQHSNMKTIAAKSGYTQKEARDFIQVFELSVGADLSNTH